MRVAASPRFVVLAIAVAVASAVAHLCTSALPFQVGSLIDGYGLSATKAGLVGFFQVGALALSMIVFSPVVHRYRPLNVCLLGAAIAVAANVMIYLAPPLLALLCCLAVVIGTGYGLTLTAAVAAAASSPVADRLYAAGNSGALLIIVVMLSAFPLAVHYLGPRGTFLAIPVLIILCVPLLLGFRSSAAGKAAVDLHAARFTGGMPLLVIWALFSFGTGAMWAFAERIGASLALSPQTVGWVLSISPFTGLIGTVLAAFCSERFNRVTVLAVGLVGGGITCLAFATAGSLGVFAAAAILYWVFTMFIYVLLLGTAAQLDHSGRLGTLGTGCERLAFAIGAPIGGLMVDYGSLRLIGITAALSCSLIAPWFLIGVARLLRNAPAQLP